ncbi:CAP domain-containing protein [Streptomyces virginiae]|uniref:CAP domain-containing protein n=1 Tax=Streptomyces virginiae TaxID=1961 RepID=UPI00224DCFF2|nr:CAP domain-containing protein [Streptomyces virginiae]MCX4960572.1 CAP domain-containing protein [Streptomyces virginiae]
MSSRTPATPSRVEARRKKAMRTRIVLSLTAAAAAVAVGVAVADSGGGTQVDQRADGAGGAKSGTPTPADTAGTASPTAPLPEVTADAAAATGSLPPETPAAEGTESASPAKPAAEENTPTKSTPAGKPPRTSGGSTGGGSGTSGGSGGSGGSSGGSTGGSSGGSGSSSGDESAVLALVNKERSAAGCGPLTVNGKLAAAARAYSDTMARSGVMSHTGPDGSTMTSRVEAAGYGWSRLGENIARGQSDADSVMKAWMNSSGHRANILNCSFREIGIGVHKGDGGPWWTQDFGTSK